MGILLPEPYYLHHFLGVPNLNAKGSADPCFGAPPLNTLFACVHVLQDARSPTTIKLSSVSGLRVVVVSRGQTSMLRGGNERFAATKHSLSLHVYMCCNMRKIQTQTNEWSSASGFEVVVVGRGRASVLRLRNPPTLKFWGHKTVTVPINCPRGQNSRQSSVSGLPRPSMRPSFLDGTKALYL